MSRTHIGMLIMLGGALLFGSSTLVARSADRHGEAKSLAVLNVVLMLVGIVVFVGGFGVAVSSAVFP